MLSGFRYATASVPAVAGWLAGSSSKASSELQNPERLGRGRRLVPSVLARSLLLLLRAALAASPGWPAAAFPLTADTSRDWDLAKSFWTDCTRLRMRLGLSLRCLEPRLRRWNCSVLKPSRWSGRCLSSWSRRLAGSRFILAAAAEEMVAVPLEIMAGAPSPRPRPMPMDMEDVRVPARLPVWATQPCRDEPQHHLEMCFILKSTLIYQSFEIPACTRSARPDWCSGAVGRCCCWLAGYSGAAGSLIVGWWEGKRKSDGGEDPE